MKYSRENLLEIVDYKDGYAVDNIGFDDLNFIRNIVSNQYKENLMKWHPALTHVIQSKSINHYHELRIENHQNIWPKEARTLSEASILEFKKTNFFQNLYKLFGNIIITNEDRTRSEEIYWRLVRPDAINDVGPLHADKWFWDLNGQIKNSDQRRLKIWISLYNEKGVNGFKAIPGSQLMHYEHKGECRDGKIKPILDPLLESNPLQIIVDTAPGDYVIFHDELIHGGSTGGLETRVSIEFTMLIKN